jgi:DNA-binding beta-propeller fold protein YncE
VIIDITSGSEVTRLPVGIAAQDVFLDRPHRRVYVTSTGDNPNQLPDVVTVIDTRKNTILDTLDGGWAPVGITRVRGSNLLLVTNFCSGSLLVIRARTGELVRTIPVGAGADAIAVIRR